MESYSYDSQGVIAIIDKMLASGESYEMRLNGTDFACLIPILYKHSIEYDGARTEWAHDFISAIGETLGIELI